MIALQSALSAHSRTGADVEGNFSRGGNGYAAIARFSYFLEWSIEGIGMTSAVKRIGGRGGDSTISHSCWIRRATWREISKTPYPVRRFVFMD